ncbi:MAG: CinA family protein [Gammaproteobacteria bacterium]|nr:CinA family protein [Gammaproteobacteria bacterium]
MDTASLHVTVEALASLLLARGQLLATAESCTGGLIAASCTELAGSSAWFERGFVTYSNESKTELLGVPAALIAEHGAVSEEVAKAMATGALAHSRADIAVAVTGVAGPSGGSEAKPVGTVWLAWAERGRGGDSGDHLGCVAVHAEKMWFPGDRRAVRGATVAHALAGVRNRLVPL